MSLIYDVAAEKLYGMIGTEHFRMKAVSGGGRGKTKGEADQTISSRSATTRKDEKQDIRGGPVPDGVYLCEYLAHHPKFHECVHLCLITPTDKLLLTRVGATRDMDSFYIHGRGPEGSDGCIVPMDGPHERHRLNLAVKNNPRTELSVIRGMYLLPPMEGTSVIPDNLA